MFSRTKFTFPWKLAAFFSLLSALNIFFVVQSSSHFQLFAILWTTAHQVSHLLNFAQTHVHWVGDVIQPCCPLSPRSPPALSLSQNQGLFLMNWLFASDGQSNEASTSAWSLPMNMQGWLPLGLTGLISLQSKELSGVFSSTTVQKHQFFVTQPSLWSTFHIHTWLLGFVMLLLLSRFSCVWLCATP